MQITWVEAVASGPNDGNNAREWRAVSVRERAQMGGRTAIGAFHPYEVRPSKEQRQREFTMTDEDLVQIASQLVGEFRTSHDCVAGGVAAALIARNGHVYTGICVDTACSLGSCAEYSAIAEMLKARQSEIDTIVAVCGSEIVPPCGRCRELIRQINAANATTRVIIAHGRIATLSELLPFEWSVNIGQDGSR
jgi:cytidine deaminase